MFEIFYLLNIIIIFLFFFIFFENLNLLNFLIVLEVMWFFMYTNLTQLGLNSDNILITVFTVFCLILSSLELSLGFLFYYYF